MNAEHLRLCSSLEWAATVEREILPWALAGRDLGAALLEVGPGPGLTTNILRGMTSTLTAVEVDGRLAAALGARYAAISGPSNVDVVCADAAALPFGAQRFSAATCFTMLHHVPSVDLQDRLFAEVGRVLQPGGVLVGVDSLPSPEFLALHTDDTCVPVDPAELPARLARAGFIDVEVELSQPPPSRRFRFVARISTRE